MSTDPADAAIPIEPVSYEALDWRPRAPEMHSRAEVMRQTGRYEAAIPASIPASIAEWSPRIHAEVLADVEDATRQLVEFDLHAHRILPGEHPALGPMAAILLRTEAASSSQIEQLTTSAKQLALAEIHAGDTANARAVVGNVHAMEAALALSGTVSVESIREMHRALMLHQRSCDAELAGRFREEQVWIGPGEAGPRIADFVAPHPDRVPEALADLMTFVRRQDLPVLVQTAVAHAQFETIHPFTDGNGRTGRALAHSILRNKGLVRSTSVPISAGLLTDVEHYFSALGEFRDGDARAIIREFTRSSRVAAVTGRDLVDALAMQLEGSRAKLAGLRSDAAAWRILPTLISQPVVTTKHLVARLQLGEMTALRALDALTERGVIAEMTGKSRARVWQHRGILDVLDEYASRIRRMVAR
ncbi:Fic family protein [Leucobacter chromiireducens]|uniref:Fic family protein n=1 Tax=Leucobacter chromiireducens subsp. solipictus TaxID=398235 RepID=A0ABS1SLU1_9MICO|nr:Fic family protein [Leucobacter chromiireducens]MBL3680238.1 Fic family protein [Leucobacter chromiireducens subsp. solipictus]